MNKVLVLIEKDIICSKMIASFKSMGMDAEILYTIDLAPVIFKLMRMRKMQRTDQVYKKYFDLLKNSNKIDVVSADARRKLALKIYTQLLKYC